MTENLGEFANPVNCALSKIKEKNIISRIWDHDHTVWKKDPAEISNRLGWLHSSAEMRQALSEIQTFVKDIRAAGFEKVLLLGMGGSSMAPEVFRYTFGVKKGYPDLSVLDSTDPGAVLEKERQNHPRKTLFIVATKSGGTIETLSFAKYFYNKTIEATGKEKAGEHFVAITDPGSGLEALAKKLNFRKIFLNDPNIGGRYSALSFFGLVPAALTGIDLDRFINRAEIMTANTRSLDQRAGENTSARFGAILGGLASVGKDKMTLITSPKFKYFGAWAEQLIAESTGKQGKGILPVDNEPIIPADEYPQDRLFVYLRLADDSSHDEDVKKLQQAGHPLVTFNLKDLYDLGGEFFRWEFAVAIAGMVMGINPFDQPNVESAKILARQMMEDYQKCGNLGQLEPAFREKNLLVYTNLEVHNVNEAFKAFFSNIHPGENKRAGRSYLALQAYLKPGGETDAALQNLRTKILKKYRIAATVGYGPRFLHSTGQLHKGDGGNGLFIQITADTPDDVPIPDQAGDKASSVSFGTLKDAQALGDRQALLDNNRQVMRFHICGDVKQELKWLTDGILINE